MAFEGIASLFDALDVTLRYRFFIQIDFDDWSNLIGNQFEVDTRI